MSKLRYILILIVATLVYVASARFYKIDINNSIFFVGLLWLLTLSIRLGQDILDREVKILKDTLKSNENRRNDLSFRLEDIKREKTYLEKKLADLSKLYTITKEMSFDIRFGELAGSLKNFLEDNFQFGKVKIVLFKYEDDKRSIEKVYEIGGESKGYIGPDQTLRDLTDFIAESKKPIFLKRNENLFHNFGFNLNIRNVLAIPLMMQRRVVSAVLIENAGEEDYDKFLILAYQVALQIERISLFDNVEKLSIMDGLTETFLRRHFLERFREEVSRARQCKMNLSLIVADLDYFKSCNDNLGHLIGDVVLKEVVNIFKGNIREIDFVARFGGEEFCILLPETDKAGSYVVAERIRKAVDVHTIKAYDESIHITVSMGISSFPEDSRGLDQLIENADKALYEAKRRGRNKVCLAS